MPNIGTPSRSSSGAGAGAPASYTDAGDPDSTMPRTSSLRSSSGSRTSPGSTRLNTPHSRMRRAMSWQVWPPKSRTRMVSTGPSAASAGAGAAG